MAQAKLNRAQLEQRLALGRRLTSAANDPLTQERMGKLLGSLEKQLRDLDEDELKDSRARGNDRC